MRRKGKATHSHAIEWDPLDEIELGKAHELDEIEVGARNLRAADRGMLRCVALLGEIDSRMRGLAVSKASRLPTVVFMMMTICIVTNVIVAR